VPVQRQPSIYINNTGDSRSNLNCIAEENKPVKRYQKLIIDAVGGSSESHTPTKKTGYNILAREMGAPSTSIHEWATYPHKVPTYKSLERLSVYFEVPLHTLLMEHDDALLLIIDELYRLRLEDQRLQVLLSFAKSL
jgi:hypothetical protein